MYSDVFIKKKGKYIFVVRNNSIRNVLKNSFFDTGMYPDLWKYKQGIFGNVNKLLIF